MFKQMSRARVEQCLADAARSPMTDPGVRYPRWYVQRWHFLPEGYLSRRSVALYDGVIPWLYNVCLEGPVLKALVRRLRADHVASILQLGCGPGRALRAIASGLPEAGLTGIDLSPFMLELARDRLHAAGDVTLVHGDCSRLPESLGTFDAAVAVHFLGHLPGPVAGKALREVRRVLAPGGRLYVIDHAWHPRRAPGVGFRPSGHERLLGGMTGLDVYTPC